MPYLVVCTDVLGTIAKKRRIIFLVREVRGIEGELERSVWLLE
jgi:hypothetical protein